MATAIINLGASLVSSFGGLFGRGHDDDELDALENSFVPKFFAPIIREALSGQYGSAGLSRWFTDASRLCQPGDGLDYGLIALDALIRMAPGQINMSRQRALQLISWGDDQIGQFCATAASVGFPCRQYKAGQSAAGTRAQVIWNGAAPCVANLRTLLTRISDLPGCGVSGLRCPQPQPSSYVYGGAPQAQPPQTQALPNPPPPNVTIPFQPHTPIVTAVPTSSFLPAPPPSPNQAQPVPTTLVDQMAREVSIAGLKIPVWLVAVSILGIGGVLLVKR